MVGQELYLQITLDENGSVATCTNLGNAIQGAGEKSEDTSGQVNKLSGSMGSADGVMSLLTKTATALGITFGAWKIERWIEGSMQLAAAQDRVDRTLKAAMITTGRYSDVFYQATLKQAQALQALTGEDDAAIESAQRLLMVFNAVSNDLMPRTTKAIMNMSIATGAEGGGLRGSTMALGKAMEGNIEGLRRYGIMIDENVHKLKGAEGVLEAVEAKVNGMAEAVGQGSGQWKILGSQWEEAKEKIGNFFNIVAEKSGLLDTLTQAVDKLNDALREFNKLEDVYKSKPGENLLKDALGFDKELFNAIKYTQEHPTLAETILKQTKEVVPKLHELTDAEKNVAKALEDINDIIAKGTLTPYQFEVYELDKKFQGLAKTLGWSTDVLEAYRLELERVRKEHEKFPDFRKQLEDAISTGKLTLGGFSTTLTPTFSEEQITARIETEADALVKRDLAVWDKAQARIKQQQDELARQWDNLAKSIGSNFTDALVDTIYGDEDAFKRLGESLGKQFLKGWIDQLITKQLVMPFINSMSGVFGYGNAGGEGYTGVGQGGYMPYVAGAAGAYSLYEQNRAGTLTPASGAMTGAGTGMMVGGPWGALVGGFVGLLAGQISGYLKDEPDLPKINAVWDIINGQVEEVKANWSDVSDQKVKDIKLATTSALENQLKFFNTIAAISGMPLPSFSASLRSMKGNINPESVPIEAQVSSYVGQYGVMENLFGKYFTEQFTKLFETTYSNPAWFSGEIGRSTKNLTDLGLLETILGAGSVSWISDKFTNERAPGDDFMSHRIAVSTAAWENTPESIRNQSTLLGQYNTPEGKMQLLQNLMGNNIEGEAAKQWTEFFNKLQEKLAVFQQSMSQTIGQGFLDSLKTEEFATFQLSLKTSLAQQLQNSISQMFAAGAVNPMTKAFLPGLGLVEKYINESLVAGSSTSPARTVSIADIGTSFTQGINELVPIFEALKPVWEEMAKLTEGLTGALGVNTTAVQNTTKSYSDSVDEFIRGLNASPLNPGQSIAGMMSTYGQYYDAALLDPSQFSKLASYVQGSLLPGLQGISPNYDESYKAIISQVQGLPTAWGVPSLGTSVDPGDYALTTTTGQNQGPGFKTLIAEALREVLGPMLLDVATASREEKVVSGSLEITGKIGQLMETAIKNEATTREAVRNA